MSKLYVSELQMSRCNAYLQARCPQSLEELCRIQRFYHYLHRGEYDCVEGNEAVEMRIDNTDCLQTEAWNYSMKILLEELEQLFLDVQTPSNTSAALDFSKEQSNRSNSHIGKRSRVRQINIKRSFGNHDQNMSMCLQSYKTRIYDLDISQMSCDFNDDGLTVKITFQAAHSLLKRIPNRYKLTKHNWKKFLNSEHKQNYLLCLHFDCPTLYVDIVVLDRQLYEKIHLEHISLTFCTTLTKALNENRAIESSDKNIRSHKRGTNSCADDRRSESSNHKETLRIKQGGCETEKSTENVSKKRALGRGSYKRKSPWLFEPLKVLLSLQAFLSSVCGAPFHTEPNVSHNEMVQSTPLLLTENCNHRTLYDLNQSCQTDQFLLKILIDNCQFKEVCNLEEEPVCLNTRGNIGVFICQKKNLKCAKGYTQRVWVDEKKPDVVNLQEQTCPEGSFQSQDIDCSYACYNMHRNLDHISEKYIVYSKGDNKSPTLVYCNYKKGFFRREEGKFLLDYDSEEEHNTYFCTHTSQFQPCTAKEFPLPNGTCTTPCQDKYFRDDHDGFQCKLMEEVQQIPSSIFVTEVTVRNHFEVTELLPEADDHDDKMSPMQLSEIVVIVVALVIAVCVVAMLSWFIAGHTRDRSFCNRQRHINSFEAVDIMVQAEPITAARNSKDDEKESHSGDDDDSGEVQSTNDTYSFDDNGNKVDDENERSGNFEDNNCQAPLLGMKPPAEHTAPTADSAHGNLQQHIITTTDKCIERKTSAQYINTTHVENYMHVTQHNYYFTADQLSQELRRHQESSYQAKDSTIIQSKSQDKPLDTGEPFKKQFDNTFNQYTMAHHATLMESVGALVVKQRPVGTPRVAGTVFRIGDCSLMTARHVIKSIVDPDDSGNVNWLLLESDDVYVNFNASLVNEERIQYRVKCTCISEDLDLDFATLQITNPRQLPLKMLLHQFEYEGLNAKQLSVIGFGHTTQYNDKCIDPLCQILNPDNKRILCAKEHVIAHKSEYLEIMGDHTMVDQCYSGIERKHNITVDCFMEHGASGAPAVSPCGRVVGILIAGLPELFFNLPGHAQKLFPPEYRFEIVLKMDYIYKYLEKHHPELVDDFFNQHKNFSK